MILKLEQGVVNSQPPSIWISRTPSMIVQPFSLCAAAKFCTTIPLQTDTHTHTHTHTHKQNYNHSYNRDCDCDYNYTYN